MTTIYIAIVDDRHTDTEVYPFTTAEAAIAHARRQVEQNARSADDIEEQEIEGWLYHATYSGESDSAWVVAKELDASS